MRFILYTSSLFGVPMLYFVSHGILCRQPSSRPGTLSYKIYKKIVQIVQAYNLHCLLSFNFHHQSHHLIDNDHDEKDDDNDDDNDYDVKNRPGASSHRSSPSSPAWPPSPRCTRPLP